VDEGETVDDEKSQDPVDTIEEVKEEYEEEKKKNAELKQEVALIKTKLLIVGNVLKQEVGKIKDANRKLQDAERKLQLQSAETIAGVGRSALTLARGCAGSGPVMCGANVGKELVSIGINIYQQREAQKDVVSRRQEVQTHVQHATEARQVALNLVGRLILIARSEGLLR
jgi:DNA repair exonuclease SbcCD ATPase subunit